MKVGVVFDLDAIDNIGTYDTPPVNGFMYLEDEDLILRTTRDDNDNRTFVSEVVRDEMHDYIGEVDESLIDGLVGRRYYDKVPHAFTKHGRFVISYEFTGEEGLWCGHFNEVHVREYLEKQAPTQ